MPLPPREGAESPAPGRGQQVGRHFDAGDQKREEAMKNQNLPKWKPEETIRLGFAMHEEASRCQADLAPRVDAALLATLLADSFELRDVAAGTCSARASGRAATLAQRHAIRKGAALVSAVRGAIRRVHRTDKAVQRKFGVGLVVQYLVPSVLASLQVILAAAGQCPAETAAAGITDADLVAVREARDALSTADEHQERSRLGARQATAQRRSRQLRVEQSVARILAAAGIVFRDRPDVLARFTAIVPTRTKRVRAPDVGPADSPPQPG
jgi:hypothetical protein